MRRKLFFFLNRLQIRRGERLAAGLLLCLLVCTGSLSLFWQQRAPSFHDHYEELDRIFDERNRVAEEERREILARYAGLSAPAGEPDSSESPVPTGQPGNPTSTALSGASASTASQESPERVQDLQSRGPGPSLWNAVSRSESRTIVSAGRAERPDDLRHPGDVDTTGHKSEESYTHVDNQRVDDERNTSEEQKQDERGYAEEEQHRVNINEADAEELQSLPGIGPVYAERIVARRQEHGPFISVEQLMEIRGIGPRRLEKLRPLIRLLPEKLNENDE